MKMETKIFSGKVRDWGLVILKLVTLNINGGTWLQNMDWKITIG